MKPIRKAVIPAAGLGTRLLSATKEQPKEMLAVFAKGRGGTVSLKPVVQLIFEQLHDSGVREFYFVVGRGKRAIEDHFTPDEEFVELLRAKGKVRQARDLASFYDRVSRSSILWVNQPKPRGFGDAVLAARAVSDGNSFLVQAGDNHVISPGNGHLRRLLETHERTGADATLLLGEVEDPRQYGVADIERKGRELVVKGVVEKPETRVNKLALLPTYVFNRSVFDALQHVEPGKGGELQLTDGVQEMIERGLKVRAVRLRETEFWLDVGTPETYWEALKLSHRMFAGRN
ncbi:MAG: NTP transferase domain-containing protein [Nitrososphaerales archaeon]|nr:NTP transferase domain-containing protein [Nitrososphaerales archaeon]